MSGENFMDRLDRVPVENRLLLRPKVVYPICVADANRQMLALTVLEDEDGGEIALPLREEVVSVLRACAVSLGRIVPHPRSWVHRLSSTWGIDGDTPDDEVTAIKKELVARGDRLGGRPDLDRMIGDAELHDFQFLEAEGIFVQGEDDQFGAAITLFAKRGDEMYSYTFGYDAVTMIHRAILQHETLEASPLKGDQPSTE